MERGKGRWERVKGEKVPSTQYEFQFTPMISRAYAVYIVTIDLLLVYQTCILFIIESCKEHKQNIVNIMVQVYRPLRTRRVHSIGLAYTLRSRICDSPEF